ncbi:MAG: ribosome-associated translation inhibitor RaiA [Thermoguttaceae bacterium]|nr:ribosome-associated translation inhibitor RaiA [Thermoguttaceae bacterium]
MQIRISTRHGTVGDETQSKITAKVEKLPRLFERLTDIEVMIDLERRDEPIVELKVSAEHRHDFVARYQSADLLGSVDQVMHKVEQQLRKYKQRVQDHHRSSGIKSPEISGDLGPVTS